MNESELIHFDWLEGYEQQQAMDLLTPSFAEWEIKSGRYRRIIDGDTGIRHLELIEPDVDH